MESVTRETIERIYKEESRRVFATLIRLLGDFDLAEDATQDAFASALKQWPSEGIPKNPRAWLISAGKFRGIDVIRRRAKFDTSMPETATELVDDSDDLFSLAEEAVKDDQLRLIFTCCHPALPADSRIALTLREVCGLTTEEIARAFLSSPPTIAQRIVRAKNKIKDAKIPYQVPNADELPDRLDTALQVIYLVFNEGYYASSGDQLTRADLSGEAIRLGRLLVELLPDPEAIGLLGLMLLQESRRAARTDDEGELVLLDDQDRSKWNRSMIEEGVALVERALASRRFGPYTIQGAIAGTHAEAQNPEFTNWRQIAALYELLERIAPSPVVELNRAVAIAMCDGPDAGLQLIDELLVKGELADYSLAHAARADLCRRLGRSDEARKSYLKALNFAKLEPEKRFIERRLEQLEVQASA